MPGDMLVFDAEREHRVKQNKPEPGRSIWIGMDQHIFEELGGRRVHADAKRSGISTSVHSLPTDHKTALMTRMIAHGLTTKTLDQIDSESLIYTVVQRALRLDARQEPTCDGPPAHRDAVIHIAKALHAGTAPGSLTQIGRAVHMSPHHFCRIFKRHTGVAIHEFRQRSRLLRASERVLAREGSLAEIAVGCGFSDQSHMTRAFTRAFGITPAKLAQKIGETQKMRTFLQEPG